MVVWYRICHLFAIASAVMGAVVTLLWHGTGLATGADMEFGRYLAAECVTCHRATATSAIPNIFGLDQAHLIEVMKAYREKVLPNPVMQNIAGRLSDEEIKSLALFFAATKKP